MKQPFYSICLDGQYIINFIIIRPCNHSCEVFSSIANSTSFTEYQLLSAMYKSALAYYNYYGPETCLNIFNSSVSIFSKFYSVNEILLKA